VGFTPTVPDMAPDGHFEILLFGLVILSMRCMGKTVLAQLTPPDLTVIVLNVTLSVRPIKVNGLGQTVIGIFILVTMSLPW
jgi:uncharacterized membrane protein YcaP (DUF421 family)